MKKVWFYLLATGICLVFYTTAWAANSYIVFAHGMGTNMNDWDVFAAQAEKKGYTPLRTNVPECGSIAERAGILAKFIVEQVPEGMQAKAVGHSMGGLDLRYIVGRAYQYGLSKQAGDRVFYDAARRISKVYTIGTPHGGNFLSGTIIQHLPNFKPQVLPCQGSDAMHDLGDAAMEQFNSDYPYSEFSVDGKHMPFLAFSFACDNGLCSAPAMPGTEPGDNVATDCIVGVPSQRWDGAPAYKRLLGAHSKDNPQSCNPAYPIEVCKDINVLGIHKTVCGPSVGNKCCLPEQFNTKEVLDPILADKE